MKIGSHVVLMCGGSDGQIGGLGLGLWELCLLRSTFPDSITEKVGHVTPCESPRYVCILCEDCLEDLQRTEFDRLRGKRRGRSGTEHRSSNQSVVTCAALGVNSEVPGINSGTLTFQRVVRSRWTFG